MGEVTTVPSFPHIPLCRDLDEIVPGKILLFHHAGGNETHWDENDPWKVSGYTKPFEEIAVVVSYPYLCGTLQSYKFDIEIVRYFVRDGEALHRRSLKYASDAGIAPYSHGKWNPTNTTKVVGYGMELYV